MLDVDKNVDLENSTWFIEKGNSNPISVQGHSLFKVKVSAPKPLS